MSSASGCVLLLLALLLLVLSLLQFREKGPLLNNAWIWASPEARSRMDRAAKRPHYRQSGFVFLLLGLAQLCGAAQAFWGWSWATAGFWLFMAAALVYAVVSSVRQALRR